MSVHMVRFRTAPNDVHAVTERIETMLAGVWAAAPSQMRYIALKGDDPPTFTLVLVLAEGADNPLPSIPVAAALRAWLPGVAVDDPTPRPCTVIGRYDA